jgi:MFS family permease
VASSLVTILAVIPVFLLGAVAILVRQEMHFDEAALGLSISAFFGTTALSSIPGGRLADRLGARWSLMLACTASAGALVGIGLAAHSWATLTAFMILGGAANGLAQPASNLALARGVRRSRMGAAFGLKQSAIPMANLLAGIVLPVAVLTWGWRSTFVVVGCAALGVAVFAQRSVTTSGRFVQEEDSKDAPIGPLLLLACGCAFGSAPGIALGAFLVQSSVRSGLSPSQAGILLALGGATGVCSRLLSGWFADRRDGGHITVAAWMLIAGASGFGVLAVSGGQFVLVLLGTLLGFGLAWGWPGLFFLAIVRLNPNSPAAASGMSQAGGAAGGVLGPLLFGVAATQSSYTVAWIGAGVSAVLAGLLMLLGRRALLRQRARSVPAG